MQPPNTTRSTPHSFTVRGAWNICIRSESSDAISYSLPSLILELDLSPFHHFPFTIRNILALVCSSQRSSSGLSCADVTYLSSFRANNIYESNILRADDCGKRLAVRKNFRMTCDVPSHMVTRICRVLCIAVLSKREIAVNIARKS